MKLRYLHIRNYPPLNAARIVFAAASPMARECATRFVIGANGSGKSHLLQAISEVFLALADWRAPHFPVTLIYELGRGGDDLVFRERQSTNKAPGRADLVFTEQNKKTVIISALRTDGQLAPALWVGEGVELSALSTREDFDALVAELYDSPNRSARGFRAVIAPGDWGNRSATPEVRYLPKTVLAYSTGFLGPWESLWQRNGHSDGVDAVSQAEAYDVSQERPAAWTVTQEMEKVALEAGSLNEDGQRGSLLISGGNQPAAAVWAPILVTPEMLKFALLAVALPVALADIASPEPREGDQFASIRELFKRAGWCWPESVAVKVNIDFRPQAWTERWQIERLRRLLPWFYAAGEVTTQPSPSNLRTLHFDLRGVFNPQVLPSEVGDEDLRRLPADSQGQALLALLGGAENSSAYERFVRLLGLHNEGLITAVSFCIRKNDTPDLIQFDELSDGERMVLGRMALFHLLGDQQDALLLLDEPETHFNDRWKREIIDIIDDAMSVASNDVLIATHSAIVLSDVFNDEIVMVEKTEVGSVVRSVDEMTFATDPSALMMTVFHADDSIGKRAKEFIEEKIENAVGNAEDIHQVEQLISRMGSGFYRSELRTLLNTWKDSGNA